MLQKFALAFKAKTIEFFAEEEGEDDAVVDLDSVPEEVITGQRVVVLKPDRPVQPNTEDLVSSLFTSVSFFRAAYLQLQIAHSPFDLEAIRSADSAAVCHLHRLSELKRAFSTNSQIQNSKPSLPLSAQLDAQVQENQSLLRTFETVVNRMQFDIDQKDAEASELKQRLLESEAANDRLERRLELACLPPEEKVESLLTVGVFNSVLKDSCRVAHRFVRALSELMKKSGWDLELVANSIYPDIWYAKAGHCPYAILSYVCLAMFESFDLDSFGCEGNGMCSNSEDSEFRKMNSLRKFIDHSTLDPLELINRDPNSDFARFCDIKYKNIVESWLESSSFRNSDHCSSVIENLRPSRPLYELFVNMASSIWMLHKLAWAYEPAVEIFQLGRGADFSMVYMESVCQKSFDKNSACMNSRPKVGFTVFPGFRVGMTVIQCWVYLDRMKKIF
ncbi:uncharacterized protein LOC110034053 [Phalaenopsis equestris]|uniref:uncharacterized protein LOC110034053 n=1 Tax=Phalaenopsis equestris TaxID=78828 RepID=UPI0009E42D99|nr:uncharacterized protein LOC110034053 [Phalaenopsis equestris]XP_020593955.1 uncharacterized protein LOC110034053 [Phalaenopsis equestris]XP_020593956.1 uncharacterized protein LOC110034053 [Phalaenopsis equestris]